MPFVAAVSHHPVVAHAVGEVAGRVLEVLGPAPDLVVLFVGAESTGALEDVVAALRAIVRPVALVGCTAASVLGDEVEVVRGGLALLAGAGFDATVARGVAPLAALVLADPFSVRADGARYASAARGPGGNRLIVDDEIVDIGAASVTFEGVRVSTTRGPVLELLDGPRLAADAALAFVGDGEHEVAVALSETVGSVPLAGIRAAGVPRDEVELVLLTVTGVLGDPG